MRENRNNKIKRLRREDPEFWTCEKLGEKFKISRQRISKICNPGLTDGQKLRKTRAIINKANDRINKL